MALLQFVVLRVLFIVVEAEENIESAFKCPANRPLPVITDAGGDKSPFTRTLYVEMGTSWIREYAGLEGSISDGKACKTA